ncbi:hypothetical protein H8959_016787 [Pygathrix nigripes]
MLLTNLNMDFSTWAQAALRRLDPHKRARGACRHLMEHSMDMDMSPLRTQNYLVSCELKADKDDHFKVDNDENEHQLSLRTFSLGAGAKDELHIVESEAMN